MQLLGRDEMLLQTRKLILGSYFQVDVAGRVSHAAQLMAECSFDLIVLCSSLSDHECERLAELAQTQSPWRLPVLSHRLEAPSLSEQERMQAHAQYALGYKVQAAECSQSSR